MKTLTIVLLASLGLISTAAMARDDVGDYSIAEALETEEAQELLGDDIAFYFGDQAHGAVKKSFGEFRTNKKTNAFNKSDTEACNRVFLSAMIALRDRAIREGGNAVIEIKSNYKNNRTSSNDTFKCGAGNIMAGVALTGKVVTL